MADINVERKGAGIWPWIIGLIVLALLIWALTALFDNDEPEVTAFEDPIATETAPPVAVPADPGAGDLPAVTSYLTTCTEQLGASPEGDMGRQHEFTVDCLQQLRSGLDAVIQRDQVAGTDVSAQMEAYNAAVQQLQQSEPTAQTHANLTRDAATTATSLMQALQGARFSADTGIQSAVQEAQQAAEGISPTTPMLDQRDAVHTFFREAGDALRMMSQSTAPAV